MADRPSSGKAGDDDRTVIDHYRRQAEEHGLEPSSTMLDQTTREAEISAIVACVEHAAAGRSAAKVLEVGCGNGYLLEVLRRRFPTLSLTGVDFSADMIELASRRGLPLCELRREDVRALSLPSSAFDVAISERCIINVLDEADQMAALEQIHRVLAPGGHLILVEAFTDGAENLNRARTEVGLPENVPPHHNRWLDKSRFLSFLETRFEEVHLGDGRLPPRNFLSTHYFISRVLYPLVTKREVRYNTEFVKFFTFLSPTGNYSPIQLFLLRRLPP